MNRLLCLSGLAALMMACATPPSEPTPTNPVSEVADPGLLMSVTEYSSSGSVEGADKRVSIGAVSFPLLLGQTNTFTYDAQKRLTQHQKLFKNGTSTTITYRYGPGVIDVEEKTSAGRATAGRWAVNEKGFVIGDATQAIRPNEYVYDDEGFMVRYEGNGQVDVRTVENGNVVKSRTEFGTSSSHTNTYTYDLSKAGVPSPLTYRGRASRHLLVKQEVVSPQNTNPTTLFTYHYDFDAKGRAIREAIFRDGVKLESVREFVYGE